LRSTAGRNVLIVDDILESAARSPLPDLIGAARARAC
jgi:hypoxanthine-guanine phosphoribosyltransferase